MRAWLVVCLLGMSRTLFASAADDYNRGVEAYQRGDYSAAESAFERAAREEKLQERSLFNLGNARARQGRLDDAIKAYQDALQRAPKEQRIQENLQWAEQLREQKPPEQQQQQQGQKDDQQDQASQQQQAQDSQPRDSQKDQQSSSQQQQQDAASQEQNENQSSEKTSPEQASEKNAETQRGQASRPEGELSPEDAERMIDAVPERTGVQSDRQQGGKRGGSTLDW